MLGRASVVGVVSRFVANVLLLAGWALAYAYLFALVMSGGHTRGFTGIPYGALLLWGSMLIPLVVHTLLLEWAARRGSGVSTRVWATVLSPILVAPLLVAAFVEGTLFTRLPAALVETLTLTVPFGLVARVPPRMAP